MAIKYIEDFFNEKDIPEVTFEIKGESGINYIPNSIVIEQIKNAPVSEQKSISNILRKIDFANGDVNNFLEHLANTIAI